MSTVILLSMVSVSSWLLVDVVRQWAERRRVLDIPNHRSSHTRPVSRGGGLAIVITTLSAWLAVGWMRQGEFQGMILPYACGAALIATVSWLDDLYTLSNRVRFAAHSLGALIAIAGYGYWDATTIPLFGQLELGWVGFALTFLWIVGLTNAYNFMDGIDGIAAGQAFVAGTSWALFGWMTGEPLIYVLGLLIATSSLGFLAHNWPPARIFMGDVGSAFLGYSFAVMPLLSSRSRQGLLITSLLILWPFLFDSIFTFLRRLTRGENVFAAHRSHLYQRLILTGLTHRFVTSLYIVLALIGAGVALPWVQGAPWSEVAVLILLPLGCIALWVYVIRTEQQHVLATSSRIVTERAAEFAVLAQASQVDVFEREFRVQIGRDHAIAVSSGSAAIQLALRTLGVNAGDDIVVSAISSAAVGHAIQLMGAKPIFVDSEVDSWNMDPELLAEELEEAARKGKLPKAVVVSDFFGQCADYEAILKTCRFYEVPVIEEAGQALGAMYQGHAAGSFGDIACFVLNWDIVHPHDDGGVVLTNRKEWADRIRALSAEVTDPRVLSEEPKLAYGGAMSNQFASISCEQLRSLDHVIQRQRAIFDQYKAQLADIPGITFMPEIAGGSSTRFPTCITVDSSHVRITSDEIRIGLQNEKFEASAMWPPLYSQPVFAHFPRRGGRVADLLCERGLCLPSGPALADGDLTRIVSVIRAMAQTRLDAASRVQSTSASGERRQEETAEPIASNGPSMS